MKKVIHGGRVPAKIWTNDIEAQAEEQLLKLSRMPFIFKHLAVMPDVHAGIGSTIGTVIATQGAIMPSTLGVDIGCGMIAAKLPFGAEVFQSDGMLRKLRHSIERSVPTGPHSNGHVTDRVALAFNALGLNTVFAENGKDAQRLKATAAAQCGSLGSGNHFIEVCTDTQGGAWVMLHSGSRGVGNQLATRHIEKAQDLMKRYFILDTLPHKDLAYLVQDTPEFDAYIKDVLWAQDYAKANRNEMLLRVLKDISYAVYGEDRGPSAMMTLRVDCHHNYTRMENHFGKNIWVTRKGAISAREGELGIIPGSMGTRSYIVQGLGNVDAFCSCSHGAGRRMSRRKARETFTEKDLAEQTAGVECLKDASVLDEIPGAYKSIDEVMENQADLATPLYELKQILCIKGAEHR